jgi:hypothetical protein
MREEFSAVRRGMFVANDARKPAQAPAGRHGLGIKRLPLVYRLSMNPARFMAAMSAASGPNFPEEPKKSGVAADSATALHIAEKIRRRCLKSSP